MRPSRHTTGSKWTGTAHGEWVNIGEVEEHTRRMRIYGKCVGNARRLRGEQTGVQRGIHGEGDAVDLTMDQSGHRQRPSM